jgi:phage/plasmid-associated DNA primase
MVQKCFFEAHNDWDSALYQLRLIFEPCAGISGRVQIATMKDDGQGATAKGTLRQLADSCLGLFNGESCRGYSCVIKQETLRVSKEEKPSEQMANLALCKHAWVDDFSTKHPISNAVLRQLCGGNTLTAARKHGREVPFRFHGQFFLACNGCWIPEDF